MRIEEDKTALLDQNYHLGIAQIWKGLIPTQAWNILLLLALHLAQLFERMRGVAGSDCLDGSTRILSLGVMD